jgi:surfactin family lipopeptide synthetase A
MRPPGAVLSPRQLAAFMRHMDVSVANLPSPYWHEWVDGDQCDNVPKTLRLLIIGSDRTDPLRVARWRQANGRQPRLIHAYGTTECTITSLTYEICEDLYDLPLGRPLPNTSAYILDRSLRPVPIGVAGDLYIGGAGVARDYRDRECGNFIDSPFGADRLYRTGDRARYLPDGNIVFAGRNDDQVKIRGFRVEPAEIESALKCIPEIRDAAVVLDADSRLVAYVVSANTLWPGEVLARLKSKLPEYMLPQSIVQVAGFPRTPSGKLDVNTLKLPSGRNGFVPQILTEFTSEIEKTIAQIWRDTLHVDHIEPGDNFFELGGHSLVLLRVHSRVEAAIQRQISIVDLFRYPTVHSLAKFLSGEAQTR